MIIKFKALLWHKKNAGVISLQECKYIFLLLPEFQQHGIGQGLGYLMECICFFYMVKFWEFTKGGLSLMFYVSIWQVSLSLAAATLVKYERNQGAISIRKTVLPGMAIPMLKIRRPNGRLIFNMEIAIRR